MRWGGYMGCFTFPSPPPHGEVPLAWGHLRVPLSLIQQHPLSIERDWRELLVSSPPPSVTQPCGDPQVLWAGVTLFSHP